MKASHAALCGLVIGAALTALIPWPGNQHADKPAGEPQPLYWVAPMDPNYRRDQPGKSPMGMDLVPVYANDAAADSPGTVRIDPDVVSNLGVRTAPVRKAPWRTEIRTVGYVRYDEDRLLHIHPRVAGWVETLYVKAEGDPVRAGQPLYALYSPELVNAQEEFLLARKRGNQELLRAARERLHSLQLGEAFITELASSGEVRQTVTFRAGRDGVVDNLGIREGFYVQPGTTMFSIGTLDEVWVEAEIFERQAAAVATGMPVSMRTEFLPGQTWEGRVDYVYPTLDPETRTVRVRLRFRNRDASLKPNMFVQVEIRAEDDAPVLSVPREALIRTGSQNRVVLALGEGRFKSVAVQVGRIGPARAEILDGLESGETVVSSAHFLLDSESSKTSDFARMHHGDGDHDKPHSDSDHGMHHGDMHHD